MERVLVQKIYGFIFIPTCLENTDIFSLAFLFYSTGTTAFSHVPYHVGIGLPSEGLLNFNNCVMLIRFILLSSKCWPQNATKSTFRQFLVTVLILTRILILILILVTALNILYCLLASRAINNCIVICVYSISPVTSAVVREIYACETHRYLIYTR